jgi:hypothetical protein
LVNNDTKVNATTTPIKYETIISTLTTTETTTSTTLVFTTEVTTTSSVFSLTTIPNQSPKRVNEQIIGRLSSFKGKFDQNETNSTAVDKQKTVIIDGNFTKTSVFVENSTVDENSKVVLNTSTPILTTTATEKMIIESPEVCNNTVVDTTMTPVTSTATTYIKAISNITTTTNKTTFASTNVESTLNNKTFFLTTTPTSALNYKRYRFCSLFYSGIVCKDTYLSNNDEDKVVIGDDVDDSDDEDDGFSDDDQVVIGVPSSLPAPPYLNNVNNDPDRFSQFYKGFLKNFQSYNDDK